MGREKDQGGWGGLTGGGVGGGCWGEKALCVQAERGMVGWSVPLTVFYSVWCGA